MTEPTSDRAGSGTGGGPAAADHASTEDPARSTEDPFADLDRRPVADHVDVFEDVHGRLRRELGTIDQL